MKKAILAVVIGAMSIIVGASEARANGITLPEVTIDFDTAAGTTLCWACVYLEDGFRITSVSGHYDIFDLDPSNGSLPDSMTVDNFSDFNAAVRVDLFGAFFDFLSFKVVDVDVFLGEGEPGDVAYISSSKGGWAEITAAGLMSVEGPLWTGVSWVELGVADPTWDFPGCIRCANGGQDGLSFDDIRVRPSQPVPEPSSLLLIVTGVAALAVRRRVNCSS